MIVGLVACHQEDPRQVASCLRSLQGVCKRVLVVSSPGDTAPHDFYRRDWADVRWVTASCQNEREKRNALLHTAKALFPVTDRDWFLTLDPDETLLWGERLEILLDAAPKDAPGYPLPRLEPGGFRTTIIPAHLFRADVERYVYLDVGVEWRGETWNLDPIEVKGRPLTGWPQVVHYGSLRAMRMVDDGWYSEPKAVEYDHDFDIVVYTEGEYWHQYAAMWADE